MSRRRSPQNSSLYWSSAGRSTTSDRCSPRPSTPWCPGSGTDTCLEWAFEQSVLTLRDLGFAVLSTRTPLRSLRATWRCGATQRRFCSPDEMQWNPGGGDTGRSHGACLEFGFSVLPPRVSLYSRPGLRFAPSGLRGDAELRNVGYVARVKGNGIRRAAEERGLAERLR